MSDLRRELQLEPEELLRRYRLGEVDLERVRSIGERLDPQLPEVLEEFYGWMREQPEYEEFFADAGLAQRVMDMQHEYWRQLFRAVVDDSYVQSRIIVGEIHARIGLPLVLYVSAMAFMRDALAARISQEPSEVRASLSRLVYLDLAVVIACYPVVMNRRISAQARSLTEMSTPVTELWDRVLMLPLVGIIDSHRANEVMSAVLQRIAATRARAFIMDIGGVSVVDTAVANHLISIAKASRLMGCTSLLSGVSPEIAATVVALGIDIGDLQTNATLQDALRQAFGVIGVTVSSGPGL